MDLVSIWMRLHEGAGVVDAHSLTEAVSAIEQEIGIPVDLEWSDYRECSCRVPVQAADAVTSRVSGLCDQVDAYIAMPLIGEANDDDIAAFKGIVANAGGTPDGWFYDPIRQQTTWYASVPAATVALTLGALRQLPFLVSTA